MASTERKQRYHLLFSRDRPNYDTKYGIENTSPWRDDLEMLNLPEKFSVDQVQDRSVVEEVASRFAARLKIDNELYTNSQPVSECAIICPSYSSYYDKRYSICNMIAAKVFPKESESDNESISSTDYTNSTDSNESVDVSFDTNSYDSSSNNDQDSDADSDSEHEIAIYTKFSKLLSKLRKAYREQLAHQKMLDEKFRLVQSVNGRVKYYDELSKLPISDTVLHPIGTPTSYKPHSSFDPIIQFIRSDEQISETDRYTQFESGMIEVVGDTYKLDFCDQGVDLITLARILDALKNNTRFTHLLLGNNMIGDDGAKLVADFLMDKAKKTRITTLYLCACNITSIGARYLCDAIATSPEITILWLKRNPIGIDGVKAIADLMKTNKSIKSIDLMNVAMLDEGCCYLFDALKNNNTLECIYIGANGITPIGATAVANYFSYRASIDLPGIKTLYIDVNRIGDEGAMKICEAFRSYKHIIRLSLGSNRITRYGAKYIFDTFVDRDNFRMLDMGMCKSTLPTRELPNNILDEGVDIVVDFINNVKSLQILNIRHVGFSEDSIDKIADAFEKNEKLMRMIAEQAQVKKTGSLSKIHRISESRFKKMYGCIDSYTEIHAICNGDSGSRTSSLYLSKLF